VAKEHYANHQHYRLLALLLQSHRLDLRRHTCSSTSAGLRFRRPHPRPPSPPRALSPPPIPRRRRTEQTRSQVGCVPGRVVAAVSASRIMHWFGVLLLCCNTLCGPFTNLASQRPSFANHGTSVSLLLAFSTPPFVSATPMRMPHLLRRLHDYIVDWVEDLASPCL
jgi:hypothetical protein